MKLVVTGGAGFIGSNLARAAAGCEWISEVAVIDDLSSGAVENLAGVHAQLVIGSVLDDSILDKVLAAADAVVHLAAVPSVPRSLEAPRASHEANATGTLAVLEAARRHGHPYVVVASSSSVYGPSPVMPASEDARPDPISPYAVSKLATECYALSYARCFDLPVLPFRFFNVFGPGQPAGHAYAAVVPAFVSAALAGLPLPVNGDGLQTRDFTFVDTVVTTLLDAVRRRVTCDGPVNLALGSRTTLLELIATLESVLGRPLEREHGPPRAGDVPDSQADSARLRALFPDVVATALRDGLAATLAWMREDTDNESAGP